MPRAQDSIPDFADRCLYCDALAAHHGLSMLGCIRARQIGRCGSFFQRVDFFFSSFFGSLQALEKQAAALFAIYRLCCVLLLSGGGPFLLWAHRGVRVARSTTADDLRSFSVRHDLSR